MHLTLGALRAGRADTSQNLDEFGQYRSLSKGKKGTSKMSFELQFKVGVTLRATGLIPRDQTMSEGYEFLLREVYQYSKRWPHSFI